ncbi:hypothetical protein SK128_015871, partial [Halocaridina rubra]
MATWMKDYGYDPEGYKEQNLDECASAEHPLCTWSIYPFGELQLSYFCGGQDICRYGTKNNLKL